jgi:O-antigen/teichoic acid export membrane protein
MQQDIKNNELPLINTILKNTGKDALRYVPAKVVPGIINFLAILIYTRIFTTEDYGNFYLTMAFVSVMSILGSNWLVESVTRFYAQFELRKDLNRFFSTIVYSYVLSTLLILGLVIGGILIFSDKISSELLPFLIVGILVYITTSIYSILLYTLRASLQPKSFSFYEILFSVGKLGTALLIVFLFKMGAISLLIAFFLIKTPLVFFMFKKFSIFSRFKLKLVSKEHIREFFRFGSPLIISALSVWLLVLSDRYMLNFFRSSADVGIYSVSYSVVDRSVALLYTILMLAAHPIIIFTWEEKGKEVTQKLLKDLSRYFFIICIPAFLGITVLSKEIFSVLVGKNFVESYKLVPFFAFCSFCGGWFQYVGKGFEIYKKTLLLAFIIFLSGALNVALNVFLIPHYGAIGAGIAKSISYAGLIILGIKLSRSFMPWQVSGRSVLRISFAGVVMACCLTLAKNLLYTSLLNLIFLITSGIIVYTAILLLSKEIKDGEIKLIKSYSAKLVKPLPFLKG